MLKNVRTSLIEYTRYYDITGGTISSNPKQEYRVVYKDRSNNTVRSPKVSASNSAEAIHEVRSRLLRIKRGKIHPSIPSKMMSFPQDKVGLAQGYYERLKSQNS